MPLLFSRPFATLEEMLRTRQRWVLDGSALAMDHAVLRHERLVIAHTRTRGIATMELGGGAPPRGRGWVWAVLDGEAHVRTEAGDHVVRSGELLVASDASARLVATSADVDLLQLVFDARAAHVSSRPTRLDASTLARLRSCASVVDVPGSLEREHLASLTGTVQALAIAGLDADLVRECAADRPGLQDRRVSEIVTRLTGALVEHPGVDDVARWLGVPERRASELLAAYFERYHPGFDGWRSYLATLRAELAWNILSTGRLRSSDLGRWLGYRSATAMYHALERRGLSVRRR